MLEARLRRVQIAEDQVEIAAKGLRPGDGRGHSSRFDLRERLI
jgi:hypothetical protein